MFVVTNQNKANWVATASSVLNDDWVRRAPALAIDGLRTDRNTMFFITGGRTHNAPWWQVDFKATLVVERALIMARNDCCNEDMTYIQVTMDGLMGPCRLSIG